MKINKVFVKFKFETFIIKRFITTQIATGFIEINFLLPNIYSICIEAE